MAITVSPEELHTRLLAMAKDFHLFCVDNGISYYTLGGTSLGARRHKGFIPWDDDIDVGVPREDYNRLISLADKLPEHLEIKFYQNTKRSPMHFVKLVDNRTTLIEQRYKDYLEGLYIDVFPLDGARDPQLIKGEEKRWKRIQLLQAMVIYHCQTEKPKAVTKKVFRILCKVISLNWLHNQIEKEMTKYSVSDSEYMANYLGAWGSKEVMPKEIMGQPILYKFEDTMLYGPEKIDEYLTNLYGDFMKLPPKEKQVFKHDFYVLDFETPYKEFDLTKV